MLAGRVIQVCNVARQMDHTVPKSNLEVTIQFVYLDRSGCRQRPSIYEPRDEGHSYKAGWNKVELQYGPTRFVHVLINFVEILIDRLKDCFIG